MRRPLLLWLIAGGAVLLAAMAIGAVALLLGLDRQDALDAHERAAADLSSEIETLATAVAHAEATLVYADDPFVAAEPMTLLRAERDTAADALESATALLDTDPDDLGTDEVRHATLSLEDAARDLANIGVPAALTQVRDAVVGSAPEVAAANREAENLPTIAFRDATDGLAAASDESLAGALTAYLDAARTLEASNADEIAEKRGPLFDARMAAQAFARDLADGVLLDFDWARLVNGYGTGGSYGGTSYWNAASGGYATITLSDSVAEQWPGAGVQALVAHEVGHAILARSDCNQMFFGSEFADGGEEPWATAWAIGLGHTANGSGESIYGRPPDALIAMSTECR